MAGGTLHSLSSREVDFLTAVSHSLGVLKWMCVHAKLFQCFQVFATLWTIVSQAPLSMGFFRQGYWSGLPCPSSGHLSNPGIELTSLTPPALAGSFFTTLATWEACFKMDLDKLPSNLPSGSENSESASVFLFEKIMFLT